MYSRTRRIRALTAGIPTAGLLLLAACGTSANGSNSGSGSKAPIVVGVAVGLTGYLSTDDKPFSEGVQLAASYFNSHGGIDGHKVVIDVVDMGSNAAKGVTVLHQLLYQDSANAIIGGSTSAATAAYAPVVTSQKVPTIAASVLPSDDQWEFSTLQPVSKSNAAGLDFVSSALHVKSIAVLSSQTPYGQEAAATMKSQASKLGISVVSSQSVATDATDLTPQLQKVQASGASAIVDILTGPVHIVEAKSAAGLGLKIPIVMGQDSRPIFRQATEAYPDAYWTGLAAQLYPHNAEAGIKAANAAFQPIYLKAYGNQPGIANAARGWDSMQILAQAVEASGAITGTALDNALEHVSYTGADSQYSYTPSDHTGQKSVPNPMGIAQYHGSAITVAAPPGS